jgi:hypothetical protein
LQTGQEAVGVLLHVADDTLQGPVRRTDRQRLTDGEATIRLDPKASSRYVAYDCAGFARESRAVEPIDQHHALCGAAGIPSMIGLNRLCDRRRLDWSVCLAHERFSRGRLGRQRLLSAPKYRSTPRATSLRKTGYSWD